MGHKHFFDCTWSFTRGYRYNFAGTQPVLYLAADHAVAAMEIGPRKLKDILGPHLKAATPPYIYVTVKTTAAVLDLTDAAIRRRLTVTLNDLLIPTDDWDKKMKAGTWCATHQIGKLATTDGRFDGILYPPYPWTRILRRRGKQNLAIFMDPQSPGMAEPLNSGVTLRVEDHCDVLAKLGLRL